uniref:Ryanodine receptor junctional solenoid domain-containing protein n=1 Tax=Eptatretus burgeri TaxID=7764 RepID=A0A8C4WZZ8_EPTBU
MPLSSGLFKSERRNLVPQCPPRVEVQILTPVVWSRLPNRFPQVLVGRVGERHGWIVQCSEPVSFMALQIPEENRCVDILELAELKNLLQFHSHTLMLYSAMCAMGNCRVAHALCSHVDQAQLLSAIENKYLPGLLRSGFYDILISLHLRAACTARLTTNQEFIVPMTAETRNIRLFPGTCKRHGLTGVGPSTSLRPRTHFSPVGLVSSSKYLVGSKSALLSPEFPLGLLKAKVISMLTEAVRDGGSFARDLVGGSSQHLFVPLIKLMHTLLTMAVFEDDDIESILLLVEPTVFGKEASGYLEDVAVESHTDHKEMLDEAGAHELKPSREGLLNMKLEEAVKLQVSRKLLSNINAFEQLIKISYFS